MKKEDGAQDERRRGEERRELAIRIAAKLYKRVERSKYDSRLH